MPVLTRTEDGQWKETVHERVVESGERFAIQLYRPRVEGQFLRIERWTKLQDGDVHWRTITKSNTTAIFGEDRNSRAFDPQEPSHVFSWLVNRTFDDKGHLMVFEYKAENSEGIDPTKGSESRRSELSRTAVRYPKRIRYGNLVSTLELDPRKRQDFTFEVVFDYGDHDQINPTPAETQPWSIRKDPFSSYRSGFEMRTYRLCQRMLMFHNFPEEKDVGKDLLVDSVNFSYSDSTGIVLEAIQLPPACRQLPARAMFGQKTDTFPSHSLQSTTPTARPRFLIRSKQLTPVHSKTFQLELVDYINGKIWTEKASLAY